MNFVALLGWSPEGENEIMSLPELVEKFDFNRINKSPAVFDMTKLSWMNGEYIKKLPVDRFYELAEPYLREAVKSDIDLKKVAVMVQTRIERFTDIAGLTDFMDQVPSYDVSLYSHKKMKTDPDNSLSLLKEVLPVLSGQQDYSNDALFESLSAFAKVHEYKTGFVMWPIRTALSGKPTTPAGATELLELFGKEESLKRIKAAIEKLEKEK